MMKPAFCNIYAQFDQTGERLPQEVAHLLGLGLVCDTAVSFAQIERHTQWMRKLQVAGGLIAPTIYPADLDSTCHDPNWWRYSEEECLRLLQIAREMYAAFGLGEMVAVNTYTPGNTFVSACRKSGVRYILGFCAPIVIEDGDWRIAHYGSPLAPYFVSDEDFRKPENPGDRADAIMMMSMEMRNPLVCLQHWSEGPWCPLNALAADRSLEPSEQPIPFLSVANDWLEQGRLSGRRMFFQINLQYFFTEKCFNHNRRALEWLAARQREGRLQAGSGPQWAELCRHAGGFERQISYWRAEMPGYHTGNRAGIYPDVVVEEDTKAQVVWRYPDPKPQRYYDYTRTWNYPAFVTDGSAPASEDFSKISVKTQSQQNADACTTTVEIVNHGETCRLPLMLWNALGTCKERYKLSGAEGWELQPVAHPGGVGGAILAHGTIPTGSSTLQITATADTHGTRQSRRWGDLLAAETLLLNDRPFTVLTAQTPEPFTVQVKVNPPKFSPECDTPAELNAQTTARLESLCGIDYHTQLMGSSPFPLSFDGTRMACWHRLWDVTAEQLDISGVEETEERLRTQTGMLVKKLAPEIPVAEPGYPTFGPLTDRSRWEAAIGRKAGERERRRVNEWFSSLRPEAGQIVVEAHPGLFLPRGGSITKTLGHAFDCIECHPGYGFQEQCVDYPQAWDWGVGGWVQWRHLNVLLTGLQGRRDHQLHLLAFDPERRGTTLRVHAYHPEQRSQLEVCLCANWPLPEGVEGRLRSEALCTISLSEICYSWPSIGLWISPVEKLRLYDWVTERGTPGMLSHAWVTVRD